jgi:hypothetical protein
MRAGDSFSTAVDRYFKLYGEATARLSESRMNLTMDQRRASFPHDALTIPKRGSTPEEPLDLKDTIKDMSTALKQAMYSYEEWSLIQK